MGREPDTLGANSQRRRVLADADADADSGDGNLTYPGTAAEVADEEVAAIRQQLEAATAAKEAAAVRQQLEDMQRKLERGATRAAAHAALTRSRGALVYAPRGTGADVHALHSLGALADPSRPCFGAYG